MCGLVGLAGNFDKELLFSMIKSLKHRGEDSSSYYLYDGQDSFFDNDFDLDDDLVIDGENNPEGYSIGLGHNLLSVFNLIDEQNDIIDNMDENRQPIIVDNIVIVFNGEIYNFNKLNKLLHSKIDLKFSPKTDTQLLACLIKYFYISCENDLLSALKKLIPYIDGDYSFAVFDSKNNNLAVCRDQIGVKPLFYGFGKDIKGFSSEKKALWKAGIKDENIKDLKPGTILYNWEEIDLEDNLIDKIFALDLGNYHGNYDNDNNFDTKDSYEVYKELLMDDLKNAVNKRVENIVDVGLIFSGGVDSTMLAVILKEIAEIRTKKIKENQISNDYFYINENMKPLNITLYAVGVESSQDIKLSQKIAYDLGLKLKTIIIDEKTVKDNLESVLTAIEDDNLMKLGVGMTIYLAAKEMKKDGIKVAISGQGADELFGGYNRYLKHFENNSLFDAYFALEEEIHYDIANMYHVNLERDDAVSMAKGVELRVPFLDKDVLDLALDIPAKFKIKDNGDVLRKHILRDVAKDIGVPEYIANRPKKAAQYGSGINKILKKKVLKTFDISGFLDSLKDC